MKNKFLGLINILYACIILYVLFTQKLDNFLSPQMQIYIKLSIIPLIIMGVILLLSKNDKKLSFSDLILLLPLIMIILANDGRLTTDLATNRILNYNIEISDETYDSIDEDIEYDFTNVDFEVIDENYVALSDYFIFGSNAINYVGKTIRVRGFILLDTYLPDEFFAIGKYGITCCAADAGFSGFIAKFNKENLKADEWYEIEGILEKAHDKQGYDIVYINVVNIKPIDQNNEKMYVYPCYSYGDGSCKDVSKYNLEY